MESNRFREGAIDNESVERGNGKRRIWNYEKSSDFECSYNINL